MNNDRGTPHAKTFIGLLLAMLFALLSLPIGAQDSADGARGVDLGTLSRRQNLPESVVLVVKMVSDDRVVPVTGVVVGTNGRNETLVVVPTEFAAGQAPLLVLDGGPDIDLDGKVARRVPVTVDGPLAVIAVNGLNRRPIRLTYNPPATDHELRLAAFPPAQQLAVGDAPYWAPVNVSAGGVDLQQKLLDPEAVPALTGPLIDLCEQWSGLIIAADPETSGAPRAILNDELIGLLESMGVRIQLEACVEVAPVGGFDDQTAVYQPVPASTPAQRNNNPSVLPDALGDFASLRALIVFASVVLLSLIAFWLWSKTRARKKREIRRKKAREATTVTYSSSGMPTQVSAPPPETTAFGTRPPGTTSWLKVEGVHADGRPLRGVVGVDERNFRVEIGRAGAHLAIDGPGISRRHAVITGENGVMTISDMGSRNGTFVNGIACQKHEIFYLKDKDVLLLGAAQVSITLALAKGYTR